MAIYKDHGKRGLDIALSLTMMPVLAVTLAGVGIAIKLDDGGPVFFKGERRGQFGKPFKMYKFRSMKVDAEDIRNADKSTFSSKDDPRVTRVGKMLRKTSLDEIPQVLNVLRGEMSFIGPRPNMATTPYEDLPDLEKARLLVKPGITGLSQALVRNSAPAQQRYSIDKDYVDRVSLMFDLWIVGKTVEQLLFKRNINAN